MLCTRKLNHTALKLSQSWVLARELWLLNDSNFQSDGTVTKYLRVLSKWKFRNSESRQPEPPRWVCNTSFLSQGNSNFTNCLVSMPKLMSYHTAGRKLVTIFSFQVYPQPFALFNLVYNSLLQIMAISGPHCPHLPWLTCFTSMIIIGSQCNPPDTVLFLPTRNST